MYKRNGYYYIFAPAGGVATGWQVVLRSKHVMGPYEDKITLQQGETSVNGPHQGGWVDTPSDESWFIHFQDADAYGRITHLQPMTWENDWPRMGDPIDSQGIGRPVIRWNKPSVTSAHSIQVPDTSDNFMTDTLGLQWQWQANPQQDWYALHKETGLRLFALAATRVPGYLAYQPNVLTQLFQGPVFEATACMCFQPEKAGDQAGLTVSGTRYASLTLRQVDSGLQLVYLHGEMENDDVTTSAEEAILETRPWQNTKIYLKVTVSEGARCVFSYSADDKVYTQINGRFQAEKGRWVGAKLGLFCVNTEGTSSRGWVDIRWVKVRLPKTSN